MIMMLSQVAGRITRFAPLSLGQLRGWRLYIGGVIPSLYSSSVGLIHSACMCTTMEK